MIRQLQPHSHIATQPHSHRHNHTQQPQPHSHSQHSSNNPGDAHMKSLTARQKMRSVDAVRSGFRHSHDSMMNADPSMEKAPRTTTT